MMMHHQHRPKVDGDAGGLSVVRAGRWAHPLTEEVRGLPWSSHLL